MTIFAACGSDDERLTTEEFLKQGNVICAAGTTAIDDAATEMFASGEEPTPDQLATFGNDVVVPNVQRQIDGIKGLNPPADLDEEVDLLLADAQTALDKIKDDPVAVLSGEVDPFADANAKATEIGLVACAGDDGS